MTEPVKRYNLRQNMPATATTFLPDVVVSATDYARLEQECERLMGALRIVCAEIEGNIEPTIRDLVNRVSGVNNGADPNDLYGYCERMQSAIAEALSAKP